MTDTNQTNGNGKGDVARWEKDPILTVEHLTMRFGGLVAVDDLSFNVGRGDITALIGPNGAGKTTSIRCMLDLIRPGGGELRVLGLDPQRDPVEVRSRCGYLPGELRLDENLRVSAALAFFRDLRGGGGATRERAAELAARLGLDLEAKIKNLSKGNKQKIGIVAAFMHAPELLLLDEPTSGLDPLVQQTVLALVREAREAGATVFFSSHVLAEVQGIADRVAIIRAGEIVEVGSTEELTGKEVSHLRIAFGGSEMVDTAAFEALPGVTLVSALAGTRELELAVAGSMDPLVKMLAGYEVESIETSKPGLEEVFLAYYGKGEKG